MKYILIIASSLFFTLKSNAQSYVTAPIVITVNSTYGNELGALKMKSTTTDQFMYAAYLDQFNSGVFQVIKPGIGTQNLLLNPQGGNVGVGTTNPQHTLDVQGSFRIGSDVNYLMYNGGADVRLKYSDRGSGGRAMVHDTGNRLTLNVGGDFTGGTSIGMGAYFTPGTTGTSYLYYGNFAVGTADTKGYKFAVAGSAIAESMTVKLLGNWPDFVFKDDYALPSLAETEKAIKENGHLPGIPSAAEVKANGVDLGEMNAKLLQKVEELTLHLIEKDKQLSNLEMRLNKIEAARKN